MAVELLRQEDAEEYIRCLYRLWNNIGPFHDVFCEEGKKIIDNSKTWALLENERIYFAASKNCKVYLYGVNPQPMNSLNISSIGKVAAYRFHSTRSLTIDSDSVICLRELIEKYLVPLAKKKRKEKIDALPQGNGVGLFEALLLSHSNKPIFGIANVTWEGSVCSFRLL